MSRIQQNYISRILGVIKQTITDIVTRAGFIDIVANSANDCLYAIHSDGRKVNLETDSGTTYLVAITGAAGKRTVASLEAATVPYMIVLLCPAADLLPNNGTVSIKPQLKRGNVYTDLGGANTLAEINSNKLIAIDAFVIQTQAGDELVLDVAGGAVTAGTLYVGFNTFSLPTA